MSYETNPITNRLKIAKGWKNSHFPTQTVNYSREMLLWFKVYLFLKAYLSFQYLRLLACEIRISENNTKILYLSVNKDRKEQKKNAKSKWKSKTFLSTLKSPLTKAQTQDARFLLYQDFKSLKKFSFLTVNSWQKKLISKAWIAKNRNASWVNFTNIISKTRNKVQYKYQRYSQQKTFGGALLFKQKVFNINSKFETKQNIKQTFWITKQRQILSVSAKVQKQVLFLEKILNVFSNLQYIQKPIHLKILLENLTSNYEKKKQLQAKLQNLYYSSFHCNVKFQEDIQETLLESPGVELIKEESLVPNLTNKIHQHQTKQKLKLFWLNLKKELLFLKRQTLFFHNQPEFFLLWRKKNWKSSRFCAPTNSKLRNTILSLYFLYGPKVKDYIKNIFPLNKKNPYGTKFMLTWTQSIISNFKFNKSTYSAFTPLGNDAKQREGFVLKSPFKEISLKSRPKRRLYYKNKLNSLLRSIWKRKLLSLTKTRLFTKKNKQVSGEILRLIRYSQKNPQKPVKKKKTRYRRLYQRNTKWLANFRQRNKISLNNKFQYRQPYRRERKNQLKLFTNLKLKYLIQDFIQKYFAVRLYVKLLWPLAEFKNLKFYRIVFPKKRVSKAKRISFNAKIRTKNTLLRKRYVFISKVTNHVRLRNSYKHEKQRYRLLKKIKRILNLPSRLCKKNERFLDNVISPLEKLQYLDQICSKKPENTVLFPLRKKTLTYNIAPNIWTLKSPKKNAYLSRKLKMLQVLGQKRLHWAVKAKYMSNLVTTLTIFAKYLDPQPLADALAKVIGNTKKHVSALKLVETVLRTLNFKRGVGYRIGLTGRANGADKSHVMYLKKLNRNRPQQTFTKNVNFAMAQARATIGTFGVKVWVYY